MRDLILSAEVTLDGFMTGPANDLDFMVHDADVEQTMMTEELTARADTIVVGRKSFHPMAGYWTTATGSLARWMNDTPKVVLSNAGRHTSTWPNSSVARGDEAATVEKLKRLPRSRARRLRRCSDRQEPRRRGRRRRGEPGRDRSRRTGLRGPRGPGEARAAKCPQLPLRDRRARLTKAGPMRLIGDAGKKHNEHLEPLILFVHSAGPQGPGQGSSHLLASLRNALGSE